MHIRIKWFLVSIIVLSIGTLSACSNSNTTEVKSGYKPSVKLSSSYHNSNSTSKAADKGTLNLAEFNNSPFTGVADPIFQSMQEDIDMFAPGNGGSTSILTTGNANNLFNVDHNNQIINGGLANLKLDKKDKSATITARSNAKWSNGMPLTAKDIEYAYEVLANKDSNTPEFNQDMEDIKGLKAYHEGKASSISGITFPNGQNGKKVVLHFEHFAPSLKYSGNTIMWDTAEPYEYEKNVPISKLPKSSQVRSHPIFVGPYKLSKIVNGESTSWVPNPYYYGKKPQIQHINIQVVANNDFTSALRSKKYDFPISINSSENQEYPQVKNLNDYTEVGDMGTMYHYLAFSVGHADSKTQKNIMDKNSKMGNVNLRQAMMYALDQGALAKKFGYGLSWYPNTLISPYYGKYYNSKTPRYTYDMSKAKKLLDEAGYKYHGKWRTQPNGKPLTVNFAGEQGTPVQDARYNYYIQQWRKLGINAQLIGGKPMEMNKMYSTLENPNQKQIDIWYGSFTVMPEPTPTQLYGENSGFNMGHFASQRNNELLNNMNNNQSWNNDYRVKQFKDWQTYFASQAAYVPNEMSMNWVPLNKRIKGYDLSPDNNQFWSNLSLTSEDRQ
ncbi:peptide ABC transporter substrate-binding protein [Philodulcilactobacillus myokoensis]|uniref:Peptide ABC transporter substrate-binding protein n=2 Tax=Philodulcilactobacillus myokoensis TaxID=2929573 RepID=A0A9W6AYX1_9LACO|nr:peptide ABC transporter substrate-binding protein [Philodulcilactobacillus myokoensis]